MRCPRPCRAKNATRFPSSVPSTIASEGSPNGVFTRISRVSAKPFIEYSPLPPMMPSVALFPAFALFDFFVFFAAIFSPWILQVATSVGQSALPKNFIHGGKRIFLPLRHFRGKFRQPLLSARPAQRALQQARFQRLDQPLLPMLHVLSLPFAARRKMLLKFRNRFRQFRNALVLRRHRPHHWRMPAIARHHQRHHRQQLLLQPVRPFAIG